MQIQDISNKVHRKCPRCDGEWEHIEKDDADYVICLNNCGILGIHIRKLVYIFNLDLTDGKKIYQIYWHEDYCQISAYHDDIDYMEDEETLNYDSDLPILPYDITIDRLKTYLLFS